MKANRRVIQIVIFVAVLLLGGYAIVNSLFASGEGLPKKGEKPPEFALVGVDGNTHRLSDYKGKALVVNFWGTFCPGCVTETPDLEKQYAAQQGDKKFEIVGINLGEDNLTVNNFIKQYGVTYMTVHDENRKVEREYGLKSYPTTFFIKPDGTLMDVFVGAMTERDINERIAKLLQS